MNKIRDIRKQVGLTQTELADAVGITQGQIARLERGDRNLSTDLLLKIADTLQRPAAELIGSVTYSSAGGRKPVVEVGQRVFTLDEKFPKQFSAIAADNDCKPVIKAGQTFYVDTQQNVEPNTLAFLVVAEEDRARGIVRYYVGPTKTGHKTRATSPQRDETYSKKDVLHVFKITGVDF